MEDGLQKGEAHGVHHASCSLLSGLCRAGLLGPVPVTVRQSEGVQDLVKIFNLNEI